ncbi:MAG: T9SS type A sorting domain-containing protein [Mariniphaga sp.]|nr:T9SS type A sorting domain-containing protein [Mariniphaga sp.]
MKKVKKSLIAVFALFLMFLIPVSVFSQLPSNWTKLPGGTDRALIDVAAFSSDSLFTIDEDGKISATFDGGNTWKERNPQTGKEIKFNALRVNPNLQTIIAVGDDNAVYRSEDMGESWRLSYPGAADAPYSLRAITNDGTNYDARFVYAVGEKGTVLKSVNDGLDWEKKELNIGANQDIKFVSFMNPDTGFVANENGIIRTFDGGNSWKVVSTGSGTKGLVSNQRTADLKKLADVVKSIDNNGGGIQTSTDYGTTWTKDDFETPCDLLATGGTVFDPTQCEDLHNGLLVYGGGGAGKANMMFMLSGSTFKGILQPKWEGVNLEGILMVMQTIDDQTIIAEALTDSIGRFDLQIPSSFSGDVDITPLQQDWDPEYCYMPLPYDFGDITLEPMEECDETSFPLRIINPTPVELNDLSVSGNTWLAVGNGGTVLTKTDTDDDGDGYADAKFWTKQNSRTNEDLLAATASKLTKVDAGNALNCAVGRAGTIIITQAPEFEIISPSKDDSLCAGSEITINWTGGEPAWNVLVYIIDVNSWAVAAVVSSNTANDGNETWNIPSNFPPGLYQAYVQEVNYATWTYGEVFTINYCPANPVCLECTNNILMNWDFDGNLIYGSLPGPGGTFPNWTHFGSPEVIPMACSTGDTVSFGIWGNQADYEMIAQYYDPFSAPVFVSGNTYSISFTGMWPHDPNRPYPVQFEFRAYDQAMINYEIIGVSAPLTLQGEWVTMSLPDWTVAGTTTHPLHILSINATNQSSALHPDSTSYGIIGAICITEVTVTGNSEINSQAEGFKLSESYPNPFSKTTVIEYTLPRSEEVTIKVFDLYGREIKTLIDKVIQAGVHKIEWDAAGLPGGTYLYRMQAGSFTQTGKTILLE